ncbi:UvrD-helicase domain-containing protein [Actinoplanes sp. NPDC026670]|uniref:UvrD-helicase domain-containing protein n=1 Tax=Actinoplanes sp. NPDC026670 TaxID=3154700 RepID=UPI0033D75F83
MTGLPDTPGAGGLQRRRDAAEAAQHHLITAVAPLSVIACPGAGKTRTIVDRHCATPAGQPVGRAIASFTRVAATEVRRRATALGRTDLLQHPHVITTLDGFFWRFLVRPFLLRDDSRPAFRHIETWRDAPPELRRIDLTLSQGKRARFDLAEFDFRYPGGDDAPVASLPGRHRYADGRHRLSDAQIDRVCRLAETRRHQLANNHHLLTGEEVRKRATFYLRKHRQQLARTLPARFTELVIDEAQDCSDVDVDLIEQIGALGLPVLTIGDPDQAIYSFRSDGTPACSRLFTTGTTITLSGNWRSSTTICRLAATLRTGPARGTDTALADHHDSAHPVWLLPRHQNTELAAFAALADAAGIPAGDRFILAHDSRALPGTTANTRRPPTGHTEALIWAVTVLRRRTPDQRARDIADKTLRAELLRFWFTAAGTATERDNLDRFGIDTHHLTRLAAQVLTDLPDLGMPAADWCTQARDLLTTLRPPSAIPAPKGQLSAPSGKGSRKASSLARLGAAAGTADDTRTGTIHSVKGEQADAVMVLFPDDDRATQLITRWATGSPAPGTEESMRVLYVAVTRARHLAALALPPALIPDLQQKLEGHGIAVKTSGPA